MRALSFRAFMAVGGTAVLLAVTSCGPVRAYPGAPRPVEEVAVLKVDPDSSTSAAGSFVSGVTRFSAVDVYVDEIDGSFSFGLDVLLRQRPIHLEPGRHELKVRYTWQMSFAEEKQRSRSCDLAFEAEKGQCYVFLVTLDRDEEDAELVLVHDTTGELVARCGSEKAANG